MLKLNKKISFSVLISVFIPLFILFFYNIGSAKALSTDINQVKIPGEAAVYYLNHATGQRKVYLNEAVFLDYGNDWASVKTISAEELAKWPEALLVKTAGSDDLYFIKNGKKVKMNSVQNIIDYHLENVLPLTVSDFELSQYQTEETYQAAGLEKSGSLAVTQTVLNNAQSGNVLVPGTRDNAVMIVRLTAGEDSAVLQSLAFKLEGLYNSELIDEIYLINTATGERVSGHDNFRERQATFYVNQNTVIIPAGQTIELKVMLNLNNIANTNNQNLRFRLESADSISATVSAGGVFPLVGTEFKMVEAGEIIGSASVVEQSLNGNGSQKNLGSFMITETSGREDVYVKELVFSNEGSANRHDLELFKLKKDGRVIANARTMENNRIVFDVNYLRLRAGESALLGLSSNFAVDYASGRSVNLSLERAVVTGKTYSLSLPASIENLQEEFILQ